MDAKTLKEDLESLAFTSSLAKFEMGNEVARQRVCSLDDRAK